MESCVRSAPTLLRSASYCAALWSRRERSLTIMDLASVVFVTLFHDRKIARLGRKRVTVEVGVFQSINGVDAFLPVETKKLLEKLDSPGAKSDGRVSRCT